jgi:NADPH2:quinone reductase
MLARGGRVAVIGSRGSVEINPRDAMGREADVRGVYLGGATPKEYADMHAGIRAGLASGVLRPIVGKEFNLDEAAAAHEAVMGEKARGKVVLIP